jgi:carbamate kinase
MKVTIPKQEVLLCCGGKGCPVVKKGNSNTIEIEDDFGGKVTLTLSEAAQLPEALKELNKK